MISVNYMNKSTIMNELRPSGAETEEATASSAMNEPTIAWCLFHRLGTAYAAPLEYVVEVVTVERLTPVPLGPGGISGVIAHRRDAAPVLDPADCEDREGNRFEGSSGVSAGFGEDDSGVTVVVLKTPRGLWCLRIDRVGTTVVVDPASRWDRDRSPNGGAIAAGSLDRGAKVHTVVDPEKIWLAARGRVERSYAHHGGDGSSRIIVSKS